MALVGLSMGAVTPFESARDPAKGTERATRFKLGSLDVFTVGYLSDLAYAMHTNAVGDMRVSVKRNAASIEAVRLGLRGWENFKDAAGNDCAFTLVDREVNGVRVKSVSDESMRYLDIDTVLELAEELRRRNTVSEGLEKNSDTALLP